MLRTLQMVLEYCKNVHFDFTSFFHWLNRDSAMELGCAYFVNRD